MSLHVDNIKKGLWDLKYSRHLQKTHSFVNLGIAFSIGFPAVITAMRETEILILNGDVTIYLLFITFILPWVVIYPLIAQQRRLRKDVIKWMQSLDKTGFFNNSITI